MTTVSDILTYLETLAPLDLAMDWDNSGLQIGSRKKPPLLPRFLWPWTPSRTRPGKPFPLGQS